MSTCFRTRWKAQNVDAYFVTRADAYGYPGYKKTVSRVGLLIPSKVAGAAPIALSQITDLVNTTEARTGTMFIDDHWKYYRLSGDQTSSTVQIKVEYTGGPPIDVEQIQIGFEIIGRRGRFV